MRCQICGKAFANLTQLENHWASHAVRLVQETPLSYLLCLPDGVTPGRHEAAKALVEACAELAQKHPDRKFTFLALSYKTGSQGRDMALDTILAIAQ